MSRKSKGVVTLTSISQAIETKDGKSLSKSLRCFSGSDALAGLQGFKAPTISMIKSKIPDRWVPVVDSSFKVKSFVCNRAQASPNSQESRSNHWKYIALSSNDWIELFNLQITLVQAFHGIFMNLHRWSLPVLYALNSDLRRISVIADSIKASRGEKCVYLEEAARRTNKAFTLCVTDRSSNVKQSRKWGTYMITAMLFRIYFKLSKTTLCNMIMRSISVAQIPPLEEFPTSDQIAFRYYEGVLKFYEESYLKAEVSLSFVFRHITSRKEGLSPAIRKQIDKNKRLVLNYLIPVRMAIGILPSKTLLKKYSDFDNIYGGFASSIAKGDVRSYDTLLHELQTPLIKRETYFAIESSRILALRTLFKRVWVSNGKIPRLLLSDLLKAFKLMKLDVSNDEIMCFVSNTIDKGLLKGYISFEKRIVVTAKVCPFPPIKSSMESSMM